MNRQRLRLVVGGLALIVPLISLGQLQRLPRVGLLATGSANALTDVLTRTFRELGYIEGQSILIERRFAEGNLERLPGFATELVKFQPDAIVALGTPATLVLKQTTSTVPIVFAGNSDPVGVGIVATLAHPGGNITGTSLVASELSAKRLELLHDVSPRMAHIAILWDSSNPGMALRVRETERAADQLHLVLRSVGPKNLDELQAAFAALETQRPDALLVTTEPFTRRHLVRILEFATLHRIPTIFEDRTYVEAGGLMSYGPNLPDVFRRAVVYVDRILKGATPANLPVEQPTTFELVINLKTAKALGLTIPPAVLARADEVIQ